MARVGTDSDTLPPAGALSAMQWWAEAGVDVLIDEEPRDWLRAKPKPADLPAPAPVPDALPGQLDLFHAFLASSETLSFATPAAPRLLPAGDPASGLMILTDMPASEDFAGGTLIGGDAGRLFDRMLAAIGRDRASIYLASLSCLRPANGLFTAESAAECARIARHHIGLAAPKAVLLLGDDPAKAFLGLSMMQARGRWHEISTSCGQIPALVSFPPSYLLEQPSSKPGAWADLQMLIEGLNR